MRRFMLIVGAIALLAAACGSDGDDSSDSSDDDSTEQADDASTDDSGEDSADDSGDGGGAIVTVGELSLDLPIVVPDDIPAPSDGAYIGESPSAEPYAAVQIGSSQDAEELRAAVRQWAETAGANYDDSIEQALLITTNDDGSTTAVYAWVRTTDEGDYPTILELGTLTQEQ